MTFVEKHKKELVISFYITVIAILFIMVGHVYPDQIQSKLKKKIITIPETEFDMWSVTHFGFFAILAYLFPNHLFELFIIGILWEVLEDGLSDARNKQLVNCENNEKSKIKHLFQKLWCNGLARNGDYWYGKWDDIFANLMGLVTGQFIRLKFGGKVVL